MIDFRRDSFGAVLAAGLMAAVAGNTSASFVRDEIPSPPGSAKFSIPDIVVPANICNNLRENMQTPVMVSENKWTLSGKIEFLRKWHLKKAVLEVINANPPMTGRYDQLKKEQAALDLMPPSELRVGEQQKLFARWRIVANDVERAIIFSCPFEVQASPNFVPPGSSKQRKRPKAKTAAP